MADFGSNAIIAIGFVKETGALPGKRRGVAKAMRFSIAPIPCPSLARERQEKGGSAGA
jgi:hypothetical protein